jgi:hypothetical protein
MKKFSSVAGVQVSAEPKPEIKEESKLETLKYKILDLMNNTLRIQSSGAARTELVNSAISIIGKEELADAILSLIHNEFSSEKVDLLESLKLEMNDWYFLDNKIEQINSQSIKEKNSKDLNIERKLMTFIDLYGDDEFQLHCEMLLNRLSKKSEFVSRINAGESILEKRNLDKKQQLQIKLLVEKMKQRVNSIYS